MSAAAPPPAAPPPPAPDAAPASAAPDAPAEQPRVQVPTYKEIREWAGDDDLAVAMLKFERRAAALGMQPYGANERPPVAANSKAAPAFFAARNRR